MTLDQQLRIAEIERRGGDELEVQTAILSVLDGRSPAELMTLPLKEYAALSLNKRFMDYPVPKGSARTLRKGRLHLEPTTDPSKLTVAQLVDFQELCKRKDDAVIADLLAVFYVPKDCVYGETDPKKGGYDLDEVKRAVLSLPVPDAVASYAFFLKKFAKSLTRTLSSLRMTARTKEAIRTSIPLMDELRRILSRLNGDGLIQ